MTNTAIEITEDELDATYSFRPNHLNPNASWGFDDEPGCLFETYGEELEFVRRQDPNTIWTVLNGDDGDLYVVSGYHFVNRVGYLLCTIPLPGDQCIECRIPMQQEAEEGEAP